ncbi:MAG: [protein-PII] uridylyltransferase [Verrucomicrobiota bacterium]|nr:[protein-PII] uridylyltransferase [Verrucomicrobiota bacterium]
MSRHLDKVLANAERQLAPAGGARPTEVLPLYKKFLRIEEHRLRLKHQAGGGGREICGRRRDLIDVLLQHVFAAADSFARLQKNLSPTPLTLLALGGYGRGELNPSSDVDVMFLHNNSREQVSPYAAQVIEQVLYLLWDIGFKVGHSTRSVKGAITQANKDMLTKTAMLEARYLTGDREVEALFRKRFRAKCVVGYERHYVELRMQDEAERHAKFGDSVYMQEPNVKSGCGGLRDYQNLLWMTYFREGALTTNQLVGKDWLSEADQRRIEAAYDFLLRLRTDLHYATGRATDVLHLNLQEQIAQRLRYASKGRGLPSEALMKDFYEHTRNIYRVTERITEQFASGRSTDGSRSLFGWLPMVREKEEKLGEFTNRQGQLYLDDTELLKKDPTAILRVFETAQLHSLDLSAELEDHLARHPALVTRTFRYATAPREIFQRILSRKGKAATALRMMHRVDFLGRYIPEFGLLTCLVQHEFFHRYTADEHTLICIDKLDELCATSNPRLRPYRELFEKLEDPLVLYLALLLHDTGKGIGARPHAEASAFFAQRVAVRLHLTPEQRKSLILVVDNHLTLSNIAQQRNLDDPETAVEFAGLVRDQKNLDALMLLTLADGQGTSAEKWSDWKESLVWHLYYATSQYLTDQAAFYAERKIEREKLQQEVSAELPENFDEEIETHFDFMPDNYFRAFSVKEIASHAQLFRSFLQNLYIREEPPLAPTLRWEAMPEQGHSIVSLCGWDVQKLLLRIAGSFSVAPLNILSADVYTRGDHVALDVFRVCDLDGRAVTDENVLKKVEETLRRAATDLNFDFRPLLQEARSKIKNRRGPSVEFPTTIAIENKTHPRFTLVQIQTPDRIGLLYELLSAIGEEGISIVLSRVSTEKGAAVDTFYVMDGNTGGKITEAWRIDSLQKRLQQAAVG